MREACRAPHETSRLSGVITSRLSSHEVAIEWPLLTNDEGAVLVQWHSWMPAYRIPSSARRQSLELLQNYEDWQAETPTIILDIPGIQAKEHHTDEELRSLTLEALSVAYPSTTHGKSLHWWVSRRSSKKKKRRWIFIKLPDGRSIRKSVATGQQSTNYRAEAYALLAAAQILNQEERLPTQCFWLTAGPSCRVFNYQEGTRSSATSDRSCPCLRIKHLWPFSGPLLTVVLEAMRKQIGCQNGKQVGAICTPRVQQRSKDHPKKTSIRSGDNTKTSGQKRTASISWTEQPKSHSLVWELDTVNSSPTSTDWKFPVQTNVHAAQVLKPPTTSCSPSTLWDARYGPVWWMPTGSFGDRWRHCSRLWTSPYSPDWKSSMAGNTEEKTKKNARLCWSWSVHVDNCFADDRGSLPASIEDLCAVLCLHLPTASRVVVGLLNPLACTRARSQQPPLCPCRTTEKTLASNDKENVRLAPLCSPL